MNLLPLMLLVLAVNAASQTPNAPASESARFAPGRFAFVAPSTARIDHRIGPGRTSTIVEVRYRLYLDVDTYAWWAHYYHGTPATARDYIELSSKSDLTDSRLPQPPRPVEFKGHPAWIMTHSYTIRQRLNRGEFHITESYMAIQRKWGYTVVRYTNDTEFLKQDEALYPAFLSNLELLPEPPGNPLLLGLGLLTGIGGAVLLLIRKFLARKRANPAESC